MRLLHIVGIVFAVIGITAALNLFSAKNANDLASAQQDRKTSNAVSLYMPAYSAANSWHIECCDIPAAHYSKVLALHTSLNLQGFVALMAIYTALGLAFTALSWTKGPSTSQTLWSRTAVRVAHLSSLIVKTT